MVRGIFKVVTNYYSLIAPSVQEYLLLQYGSNGKVIAVFESSFLFSMRNDLSTM